MRFLNESEVQEAAQRWEDHPVLGPATTTLSNLVEWTNANSDGWAYWPKPCRAAAKLQELIENNRTAYLRGATLQEQSATYRAALRPIKAFRTRQGADFEIVEV